MLLGHLIGDGSYLTHQPLRYTTASEENSAAVARAAEREFGATVRRHAGRGNWHQLVISATAIAGTRPVSTSGFAQLGIWNQRSADKRVPDAAFTLAERPDRIVAASPLGDGRHDLVCDARGRAPTHPGLVRDCERRARRDVAALLLRCDIVARTSVLVQHTGTPLYNVDVSGVRRSASIPRRRGWLRPTRGSRRVRFER